MLDITLLVTILTELSNKNNKTSVTQRWHSKVKVVIKYMP